MGKKNSGLVETTNEDFEAFIEECERWIDTFGLHSWESIYEHKQKQGYFAMVSFSNQSKHATFTLSKYIPKLDYSTYAVRRAAFHEVCELLFNELATVQGRYNIPDEEVNSIIHGWIRSLENTVFTSYYYNRFVLKIEPVKHTDVMEYIKNNVYNTSGGNDDES